SATYRHMGRAQLPILNSEVSYFISGDAVPTGMGGRRVSPVDAGGSGRSRSGIRLRAENTPLSWSALGGSGSTAATGRAWISTEGTGSGRTSRAPGWRSAPVAGEPRGKSDDTTKKGQRRPRAQLSVLQMRVLVPQFRSKIDLHPLLQLDRNHRIRRDADTHHPSEFR